MRRYAIKDGAMFFAIQGGIALKIEDDKLKESDVPYEELVPEGYEMTTCSAWQANLNSCSLYEETALEVLGSLKHMVACATSD